MTNMNGLSVSLKGLLLVALLLVGNFASAFGATVKDIRLGVTKERTRIVLDLQSNVDFDIFLLDRPRRVVVDLPSLEWPENQPKEAGLVQKLRFGQFTADKSRLVIDAKGPVKVAKSFMLPPSSGLPHRLVIDLVKASSTEFASQVAKDRAAKRSANKRQKRRCHLRQNRNGAPIASR